MTEGIQTKVPTLNPLKLYIYWKPCNRQRYSTDVNEDQTINNFVDFMKLNFLDHKIEVKREISQMLQTVAIATEVSIYLVTNNLQCKAFLNIT